ncbi:MAG: hypothetical protein Q9159_002485 [Coniocarpon cinnabarinum]
MCEEALVCPHGELRQRGASAWARTSDQRPGRKTPQTQQQITDGKPGDRTEELLATTCHEPIALVHGKLGHNMPALGCCSPAPPDSTSSPAFWMDREEVSSLAPISLFVEKRVADAALRWMLPFLPSGSVLRKRESCFGGLRSMVVIMIQPLKLNTAPCVTDQDAMAQRPGEEFVGSAPKRSKQPMRSASDANIGPVRQRG